MGEVYKAIDTSLKRAVAIKVLPASVAADAERLARFQREAEVLAALNHPNVAAIYGLEKTPAFTALVMELLRRCLNKDVRARQQSAGDARLEIEEARQGADGPNASASAMPRTRTWIQMSTLAAAAAIVASGLTLLVARRAPVETGAKAIVQRFVLDAPSGSALTPVVSPDGRHLAVSGRAPSGELAIWLRAMDGTSFEPVGRGAVSSAFWSPDGQQLGFVDSSGRVMRMPVAGGPATAVADAHPLNRPIFITWGGNGTIVIASREGVFAVTAKGGTLRRLTPEEKTPQFAYELPQWLSAPGALLYGHTSSARTGRLLYQKTGAAPLQLLDVRSRAQYTPQGLLVARSSPTTVAVLPDGSHQATAFLTVHDFDITSGTLRQPGATIAEDASLDFSASENGTLVYRRAGASTDHRFEWVDAQGRPAGDGFPVSGNSPFNLSREGQYL